LLINSSDSDLCLTLRLEDSGYSFGELIVDRVAIAEVEDDVAVFGLDAIPSTVDLE
jgi:hypothetical protein